MFAELRELLGSGAIRRHQLWAKHRKAAIFRRKSDRKYAKKSIDNEDRNMVTKEIDKYCINLQLKQLV